jgi:hypothetical protein
MIVHVYNIAGVVLPIAVLVRYGRDWMRGVL